MKVKSKTKTTFRCQECEHWNSFVEEEDIVRGAKSNMARSITSFSSEVVRLDDVRVSPLDRSLTGIVEFDRVLGGGVVPGSVILLGGPPGIGKSTLMLQVCQGLTQTKGKGLYISG